MNEISSVPLSEYGYMNHYAKSALLTVNQDDNGDRWWPIQNWKHTKSKQIVVSPWKHGPRNFRVKSADKLKSFFRKMINQITRRRVKSNTKFAEQFENIHTDNGDKEQWHLRPDIPPLQMLSSPKADCLKTERYRTCVWSTFSVWVWLANRDSATWENLTKTVEKKVQFANPKQPGD